ncbi:MAG: peptidoglycan-binding protein [Clostridia bacterium]|nr:peptidoglycan-binding protein [Clostridia bacterium]
MYNIYDTPSAIQNVQRYLYFLSKKGYGISTVYPDGIYGDETVISVKDFQKKQGITESGVVDYITFTSLINEYNKVLNDSMPPARIRLFPRLLRNQAIYPGEENKYISLIQAILVSLGVVNEEFNDIEITGKYDSKTEKAVNSVKQAFGLSNDSVIDKEFFATLTDLYESFINDDT